MLGDNFVLGIKFNWSNYKMDKIFQVATNISTPLMLAGFFAAAFFFIARQIIKAKIFPQLSRQLSGDIIKHIIQKLFILSLTAMILGFAGYIYGEYRKTPTASQDIRDHYELPSDDLIKLILQDVSAINLLPKPDTKNLTFEFKVVPKSKEKFVPLKTKADLVLIDSAGKETKYMFDANFDDDGIKPQVSSRLILDGPIPKQEYLKIISLNNYKAKCIYYYDSDIIPTNTRFVSETFPLNKESITDHSE